MVEWGNTRRLPAKSDERWGDTRKVPLLPQSDTYHDGFEPRHHNKAARDHYFRHVAKMAAEKEKK